MWLFFLNAEDAVDYFLFDFSAVSALKKSLPLCYNQPLVNKVLVLLVLGLLVLTINSGKISLLSLDDCFYARKGVEMARSGRFFTVTWNYRANFQNPSLQTWILGKSFQTLGENDFAARVPSILMAIAILLFTYKIGARMFSQNIAVTAVALLLITPQFLSNGRRCMVEIPLTFWICIAFFIFLKGFERPKLNAWLAMPLGAALLTKSVLGLLPILVIVASAFFNSEIRSSLKQRWFWIGIAGGIFIGLTWPIHQYSRFGIEALREHYFSEIFSRSVRNISIYKLILGYPEIVFTVFLPLIFPALPGLVKIFKERKESGVIVLIFVWSLIPILLYSFSSARSSRYIFPIIPALAIAGAYWLETTFSRFCSFFSRIAVPIGLLALAILFWISPETVLKDENKILKANHHLVRNMAPELEPIPYSGDSYWSVANPLMYYAERQLAAPTELKDAIVQAQKTSGYLIVDPEQLSEIKKRTSAILADRKWVLVQIQN
jgi:4-amino-4-deoxy-L-arabinose transferase-like glycosyltransferase